MTTMRNGSSHDTQSVAHSASFQPSSQQTHPDSHADAIPSEEVRPLKILFVVPKGRKEEESGQKPLFTMAMGVLTSITPPQHHVEMVDELFGDEVPFDEEYDFVGITTRTCNAFRAYEIGDEFRRRGVTVILGGVHASFNYDEASPHCDCIVRGEAENLWTTLLQDVAQGTLKPFYDSKDFPPVKQVPELDYKRIFEASKRGKVDSRKSIPIYISRGCPYNCSFCVTPNYTGKLYRMQSAEAVQRQIEQAKEAFFKKTTLGDKPWFMFTDENLGVNKKKLWDVLETLKTLNIRFSTFISINFLEDPKTVRLLVESGCAMALVGFESINQKTLEQYSKSQNSVKNYEAIIEGCRKAGLNVQGNFLVNPAIDTYEDMEATEQFVRRNHLMMPLYTIMTPYPGTRMYWEYKEKGLVVDEDWDKYTSHNLVVKCKQDPMEYQLRYLEHFLGMYSWGTIFNRVFYNNNKLINLVTSLILRKNLQDQIKSIKEGKNAPLPQCYESEEHEVVQEQPEVAEESSEATTSSESRQEQEETVHHVSLPG